MLFSITIESFQLYLLDENKMKGMFLKLGYEKDTVPNDRKGESNNGDERKEWFYSWLILQLILHFPCSRWLSVISPFSH